MVVAQCKLCGHEMSTKCDRMENHHKKCFTTASSSSTDPKQETSKPEKRARSPSPPPVKRRAVDIAQHVVRTTPNIQSSLDEKIAKLFYGCNLQKHRKTPLIYI